MAPARVTRTFGLNAGRCGRAIDRLNPGAALGAGASGAAGAADAVDIVIGMMRNVEIEDVAHGRNIEAAGGDVGSDEEGNFTLAELGEGGGARRLVHVAMQGADAEAVLLQ